MASVKLGFIGFGEVGSTFTKAMSQHGADIIVYDLLLDQPGQRERVAARIRETGSEASRSIRSPHPGRSPLQHCARGGM